jgi:integrase
LIYEAFSFLLLSQWWEKWWEIYLKTLHPNYEQVLPVLKSIRMANTLKVLFWLHKTKTNKHGLAPLIIRISYNKVKSEKSTGFYLPPSDWNISRQKVKGEKAIAKQVNSWIDFANAKLGDLFREAMQKQEVHLPTLLNHLFAKPVDDPTLLETIIEHNVSMLERVGNDYSHSTYEKYVFTYNKVQSFIQHYYKRKDLYLRDLTTKFIMEFDHYLRVVDKNQHNTAVKYCINLKKVINLAVLQGKIANSPFNNFKTIYKDTPQVYLEGHEVQLIEKARLCKNNLLLTRDLFLFQCFTGLAYADLINLKITDITLDAQNRSWIVKPRQKSGIVSTIPLLGPAQSLIQKYSAGNISTGTIFPYYSIQKYNQYLGEIGDLIGLKKKLSSHAGRRTFGNIALSRGVSINVISKILGHSNTIITQRIYAITTQKIISSEIIKWE